jgi:hypothetical protein
MMLIVPLTFGSMTKLRPVISATARTTASISALTKLSVTRSSVAEPAAWAGATTNAAEAIASNKAGPTQARTRRTKFTILVTR